MSKSWIAVCINVHVQQEHIIRMYVCWIYSLLARLVKEVKWRPSSPLTYFFPLGLAACARLVEPCTLRPLQRPSNESNLRTQKVRICIFRDGSALKCHCIMLQFSTHKSYHLTSNTKTEYNSQEVKVARKDLHLLPQRAVRSEEDFLFSERVLWHTAEESKGWGHHIKAIALRATPSSMRSCELSGLSPNLLHAFHWRTLSSFTWYLW